MTLSCVHANRPAYHIVLISVGDIVHQIGSASQISISIVYIGEGGLAIIALAGGAVEIVIGITYTVAVAVGGGGQQTVIGQIGVAGKHLISHRSGGHIAKSIIGKGIIKIIVGDSSKAAVSVAVRIGDGLISYRSRNTGEQVIAAVVGVIDGIPGRIGGGGQKAVVALH